MLDLDLPSIPEPNTRESFRRVEEFVASSPILSPNLKVMEITFGKAETALKIPHGLSFIPKDVIITSTTGTGAASILYGSTDATNLVITTTGACIIRLLVGTLGG